MRLGLLLALLLGAAAACGDESRVQPLQDSLLRADDAPAQPAPAEPAPVEPTAAGAAQTPPAFGDGPPPLDRAVEPPSADRLRVLVLSGGGYHEFASNLKRLLAALDELAAMTVTELVLAPGEVAAPTSRRALEEADLPAEYDVLLVYTQGDLALTPVMQEKLLGFVRGGGGLVALHCALDSFPGWIAWDEMLRGRFERHPPMGDIVVMITDPSHPVTTGLPPEWILRDEFYHLKDVAPDDREILMVGVSPEGGGLRPVTWTRRESQGRVVCTILGHGPETHGDARYHQLVVQALAFAAGR